MSSIEWTEKTWNPVVGCTPVSPGCLNCYAARMARRQEAMGTPGYEPRTHHGFPESRTIRIAEVRGGRPVFTGEVRCLPERLEEPLRWRKPRLVFVNSMSDLFHEAVPFEFVDRVFAVMALCPQHTFQVLTKRPERMAEYMGVRVGICGVRRFDRFKEAGRHGGVLGSAHFEISGGQGACFDWPLSNVWLGTSTENQATADERIPHLLRCPAAVRFLSVEPMLGPVDLSAFFGGQYVGLPGDVVHSNYNFGIGWVICGGESGPGARPFDVAWARSLRDQCKAAGVPFFMKQLGSNPFEEGMQFVANRSMSRLGVQHGIPIALIARKGNDMSEWPEDLRVREMPDVKGERE